MNGVNFRRLIKQYFDIINGFKQTFVKMSNILVIDEEIYLLTNKYKWLLKEINEVYRCMRILNDDDNLIKKTRIHMQKTILLWKVVTLSTHLFEDHILNQMSSIECDMTDKTKNHV